MSIGAKSPAWRRFLLRRLGSIYLRRKAVTADGCFDAYVSGGSSLKFLDPRRLPIDPVHTSFIRDWITRGAMVWDIGAHLGLFAFPAALKAREGTVYAFEPDIELSGWMLRSLRLPRNIGLNLQVIPLAVSDQNGIANFQISTYSTAMSRLEGVAPWLDDHVKVRETRSVPTLTIDTLANTLAPPAIIKVDVEGAEMKVLRGGRNTIAKYRPVMLIEGPSELWGELGSFLREYNYVILDGSRERGSPLDQPVWDTVAVPREKCGGID